jgi:hypothetical protein
VVKNNSNTALKIDSEIFNRTKMSLLNNDYIHSLAGYRWDANATFNPSSWVPLKIISKENGLKLSQFLLDFMNKC